MLDNWTIRIDFSDTSSAEVISLNDFMDLPEYDVRYRYRYHKSQNARLMIYDENNDLVMKLRTECFIESIQYLKNRIHITLDLYRYHRLDNKDK